MSRRGEPTGSGGRTVRERCARTWVLLALCLLTVGALSGGRSSLVAAAKGDYLAFKDPGGRLTIDYPKGWQVITGMGDVVATFAEKHGEAAVVVERFRMDQSLQPDEITDLFGQIEADVLAERQPKASNVVSTIREQKAGGTGAVTRSVVITYLRPGLGGSERAVQYSLPIGQDLFRVTCSAPSRFFFKYDAMFAQMAESLKPTATAKPTA